MNVIRIAILLSFSAMTGCATIIHGTNQDVGLASSPTGAKVFLNNKELGITPVVAKLSRKDNHIVKFELDGYQSSELTLTRSVSGWVWGNLVFGGIVGLAVDGMSGGLYKLTPDQLNATMGKGTAMSSTKEGLYIAVVMRPDTSWTRIGTLARINTSSK